MSARPRNVGTHHTLANTRTRRRSLTVGWWWGDPSAIGPRYEALIYTGAYLGPRWSELAGLKRVNLDLARSRVRIVGALEKVGNGWRYSEQLKTPRSRRTLLIPPFIADLLEEHLGTAPQSEFVFSSPCGDILNYGNFRRRFWDPAVARARLVGVTTHALRHTCLALMIAEGAGRSAVTRDRMSQEVRLPTTVGVVSSRPGNPITLHYLPGTCVRVFTVRLEVSGSGPCRERTGTASTAASWRRGHLSSRYRMSSCDSEALRHSTGSMSRCRRVRCTRSSDPTVPERRVCSTASTASTALRKGRSVSSTPMFMY